MAIVPVPGLVLGERYRLVRQLAVGGMGQVWVAQDTSLSREVAIKVLKPEFAGNTDFLRRLRTEARNAASLSHSGIAQLFDYGERDGIGYLVLELVLGEPMSDLLERSPVLPLDRALDILAQTSRALHSAHISGVVHRDVKPGNILLDRKGTVKITDFGVSLAADQAPMTATGMVMGTAQYLSPEQAVGRPATPSSDIYALGVIGFEALVGHRPFTGKTAVDIAVAHVNEPVPSLPASVPPDVASLITRMLAKDPSDRPRSGAQLAIMLDELSAKYQSNPWLGAIGSASGPQPAVADPSPNRNVRTDDRRRPVSSGGGADFGSGSQGQARRGVGNTPVQGNDRGLWQGATPAAGRPAGSGPSGVPAGASNSQAGQSPGQSYAQAPAQPARPAAGQTPASGAPRGTAPGPANTGRPAAGTPGSGPWRVGTPAGPQPTAGGYRQAGAEDSSTLAAKPPRKGSSRARSGGREPAPPPTPRRTSTTTGQRWGNISWQAVVLGLLVVAVLIGWLISALNSGSDDGQAHGPRMSISAAKTDEGTTVRQQYRVTADLQPNLPVTDGTRAAVIPTTVKDI